MRAEAPTTRPFTAAELEKLATGALRSARRIVPMVMDLVKPHSVVDVGCGLGSWLAVFRQHGIEDFLGIDGFEPEPSGLEIPARQFRRHDLAQPLELDRRFDLVVCLEVAEHLLPDHGRALVESLTRLGPIVLFSAAVPGQGGRGHVNEQWPDYWAGCFDPLGYRPVDCIREAIWEDGEVEPWYRQNALLYVDSRELGRLGSLVAAHRCGRDAGVRRLVHPALYEKAHWMRREEAAARELVGLLLVTDFDQQSAARVPGKIVLLDEATLDLGLPTGCGWQLVTFPQSEGQFSGPPTNEHETIAELERWRTSGARLLAVAWPAFWWLDYYQAFAAHLERRYRRLVATENLRVFDLRDVEP